MAVVPPVPAFVPGETPSTGKMNQLGNAVTFIHAVPALATFNVVSQTINTGTVTALSWTKISDRDGGYNAGNPTRYTAQTAGYYRADANAVFGASNTGDRQIFFQITTGANNPSGAGVTTGFAGVATTAFSTPTTGFLTPLMYIADYIEVYVSQSSGGGLSAATSTFEISFISLATPGGTTPAGFQPQSATGLMGPRLPWRVPR